MFALTTVDDAVHIPPALFGQDHYRAVMDRINAKFANRVMGEEEARVCSCVCARVYVRANDDA